MKNSFGLALVGLLSTLSLTATPAAANVHFSAGAYPGLGAPTYDNDFSSLPMSYNYTPMFMVQDHIAAVYQPFGGGDADPSWWTRYGSDNGLVPAGHRVIYNTGGGTVNGMTMFVRDTLQPFGAVRLLSASGYLLGDSTCSFNISTVKGSYAGSCGMLSPTKLTALNFWSDDPTDGITFLGYSAHGFVGSAGAEVTAEASMWDRFVSGAVPEPSTWALMIVGFGLAGTALRRSQRALA